MAKILVTGATGFVGGRLKSRLREAGHDVVCASRNPDTARERWPGWRWVAADAGDEAGMARALEGCEVAYYLVHGMRGPPEGWIEGERHNAHTFARAAARAGVGRVVYLGGVAPAGPPSPHLQSRLETGRILREGAVPCLELRAAMIIGHGSASWMMVRDLAARLPIMVVPQWLKSRSMPVAIDDVVSALVAGATMPLEKSAWFDLPGPEVLTGREILERVAGLFGRRPVIIAVPVLTPRLSAYWIGGVTRTPTHLAAELVAGLTNDLLPLRRDFWERAGLPPPMPLEDAARRALAEEAEREPRVARMVERTAGALTRRSRPQGHAPHP
jgi:uncharacterized protein YbjT (DUF2867 family)